MTIDFKDVEIIIDALVKGGNLTVYPLYLTSENLQNINNTYIFIMLKLIELQQCLFSITKYYIEKNNKSEEIDQIISFEQSWPSTALGLGGLGGDMITTEYTTVIILVDLEINKSFADVFFAGKFAYRVPYKSNSLVQQDIMRQSMASVKHAGKYL